MPYYRLKNQEVDEGWIDIFCANPEQAEVEFRKLVSCSLRHGYSIKRQSLAAKRLSAKDFEVEEAYLPKMRLT
jgi:hypothetical protein